MFQLIFTSGTTGTPKGVMLAHDNVAASIESFHHIVPPMEHRIVSLLPLSHLLEQAVGLYYALDVGADILYVRSRNPRVIFDALREHRVTSMVVVPQVLDLFWSAIEREIDKRGRRGDWSIACGASPATCRSRFGGSCSGASTRSWAGTSGCSSRPGRSCRRRCSRAWEDLGVTVLQGYGATETGTGACTTLDDHGPGTVGRTPERHPDAARGGRGDPVPWPVRLQGLLERARADRRRRSPTTAGTGRATSATSIRPAGSS